MDVVTVCDRLERAGELERVGGREYVHSLPDALPRLDVLAIARKVITAGE